MRLLRVFALLLLPAGAQEQERKPIADHVVLISIDGLRPDAILKGPAPHMQSLIREGAYAPKARTVQPSIALPTHASMLTGLECRNHKILHNVYKPGCAACPTLMSIAKDAGLTTAMLFAKDSFLFLVRPGSLDFLYANEPGKPGCDTSANGIAKAFVDQWSDKKFKFTFVHIEEPDVVGHVNGWMSAPYLQAVVKADLAVGEIVAAIRKAGLWEKTAVIVTSGHGGSGVAHLDNTPENATIPWICVGPRVRAGTTLARVRICDTAPTVLALLALAPPRNVDGRFLVEILSR